MRAMTMFFFALATLFLGIVALGSLAGVAVVLGIVQIPDAGAVTQAGAFLIVCVTIIGVMGFLVAAFTVSEDS